MTVAFFAAQVTGALVGIVLLLALGVQRAPVGLCLPAAWLAGTGALAVERLALAQAGIEWTPWALGVPWIAVAGVALRRKQWTRGWRRPGALDIAITGVIVAWSAGMFWQARNEPLTGWDAWAMWFLKGRALYQAGGLPSGFFTDPFFAAYAHLDYPLLVPLAIAGTYAWTGDVDTLMKGWWPLLAGAMAAGVYWGLAGVAGTIARVGGLVLFLGLPEVWRHTVGEYAGYADLPLAALALLGGIFLCRRREPGALAVAALFFGLAGFTKNEGLVVALVGMALVAALARPSLVGLATAGLVLLPWQVQRGVYGLQPEFSGAGVQWERLGAVWEALSGLAMDVSRFGYLWLGVLLLGAAALARAPRRWVWSVPLVVLLGAQVLGAALAYLVTPSDVGWHLKTSADRVTFQWVPLGVLLTTVYLSAVLRRRGGGRAPVLRAGPPGLLES